MLILRKNRSSKINAELLQKLYSKREESSKSFRKTTMMMLEVFRKLEPNLKRFRSRMRLQIWSVRDSSKILMLRWPKFRELKMHSKLLIAISSKSREKASVNPKITTRLLLM